MKTYHNYSFINGAREILLNGFLNILFIFTPLSIISYSLNWLAPITFTFSVIAIVPFAERLGFITEQLALHTNPTIGGLLNATFGNATELIVSIFALTKGLLRVVQLSLLGSILSNLLLVLGSSLFVGGIYNYDQKFQKISSQINSSLLLVSVMSILFPTILIYSNDIDFNGELLMSRIISIFLFILYILYLVFQLYTHKTAYDSMSDEPEDNIIRLSNSSDIESNNILTINPNSNINIDNDLNKTIIRNVNRTNSKRNSFTLRPSIDLEKNNENSDEDIIGFHYSLFWLIIITAFIAFLSEAIVSSIEKTSESISGYFLATIVIPIIGNAAEHTSAITFAAKNNVDISIGIAVGSSTQIALMVFPLLVIIGWMINQELTLNLEPYESSTLFLSVLLATFVIKDGTSNWLLGSILICAYFIILIGYLVHFNNL
jgi:Ca2+:H+ antiporter